MFLASYSIFLRGDATWGRDLRGTSCYDTDIYLVAATAKATRTHNRSNTVPTTTMVEAVDTEVEHQVGTPALLCCAPEGRGGDDGIWRLICKQTKVEPYSPLGVGTYEMGNIDAGSSPNYAGDSQQEFFAEVNELRDGIDTVKANISRIESLHQRSLTDIDESTSSQTQHQLDALVAETSALNKNLANRIKRLKGKAASDPAKGPQVGNLDRNFKDTLRKYQTVEAAYSKRAKEQMARQYRIVKPDASEQEVEEACSDSQGAQIFSQAVRSRLKA